MDEQSKAFNRRKGDWRYSSRWITGRVIDVGCGPDPLKKEDWPSVTEVVPYDLSLGHKDAQYLPEFGDNEFDAVHSSHCLEHVHNPKIALTNWLRVLKPGGFIVCTVPEELLYEMGQWPSRYNGDHKSSFSMRYYPLIPSSTNLAALLWKMQCDIEHLTLLTEHWDRSKLGQDQTLGPAECCLEFVIRKLMPPNVVPF